MVLVHASYVSGFLFVCINCSDSVTRVNDSTRLEIRFLVTLTRLESLWEKGWLDSTRVTFFTEWLDSSHNQWLETGVRVIFAKSQGVWSTNPVCLHTKEWSFFGPVIIKIGANFLFWLLGGVVLYPKGQVGIHNLHRGRPEICFSLRS